MKALPHPLSDDLAELIARRFRLLGEPIRVRLLDQLRDGEGSVNELADRLGAGQQNVSKHLGVLADGGVVTRRKDGNHVYYRIADEGVLGLCEQVCGSLEHQVRVFAAVVGAGATDPRGGARRPFTDRRGVTRDGRDHRHIHA